MKGPLCFLLSLAGVVVVSVFVLLPLHRERGRLEGEILDLAARTGRPSPESPSEIAALVAALGLTRGDGDPAASARIVALEFAPIDLVRAEGRSVTFPAAWSDVPKLLGRLAAREGLVFRGFSARPTEDPERCRITLEFATPVNGFGVR